MDDDEPLKKITRHEIGQDLSDLSLDELEERIELLKGEIQRLATSIADKRASADVAASFFKS